MSKALLCFAVLACLTVGLVPVHAAAPSAAALARAVELSATNPRAYLESHNVLLTGGARAAQGTHFWVMVGYETQLYDTATHGWVTSGKTAVTVDAMGRTTEYLSQTVTAGVLTNSYKTTLSYTGSGVNATEEISYYWGGTDWINGNRYVMTVNGHGDYVTMVVQGWVSGAWKDSYRYSYTYDGSYRTTSTLVEYWSVSAWVNNTKTESTFDGSGNLTRFSNYSWVSGAWSEQSRTDNTYDGGGHITQTVTQIASGGSLVNSQKTTYTNDGNGHPTETISYFWSSTFWMESRRIVDVYDGSGYLTQETTYNRSGSTWTERSRTNYTRDGAGRVTLQVDQSWGGSAWTDANKTTNVYDGNGNTSTSTNEQYYDGAWHYMYRVVYSWQNITAGVADRPAIATSFSLSQNYPNPFNPSTQITFSLIHADDVTLAIFDQIGREVARLADGRMSAGEHAYTWYASNQPSGLYYCRLTVGGVTETRGMVLAK